MILFDASSSGGTEIDESFPGESSGSSATVLGAKLVTLDERIRESGLVPVVD